MTEITNQQIIDRYLKRFFHSKKSQSIRKYTLEFFFRSDNFGYNGHVFNIIKRDVIDYFDYLNHLTTTASQIKINKWMIFHRKYLSNRSKN
ncbi:MAG: hypothetical protein ACFFCI_05360 [Promethearchaeota archaeon]